MHSMSGSAMTMREQKRWQNSQRITACALQLTDRHGLDGFTMDDLAEAAGVSRRTLFNYFPGKLDAVLGAVPEIPPADLATFHAGGPHGTLFDDLGALAQALIAGQEFDVDTLTLSRRVLVSEPRLIAAAHARFEELTESFAVLVLERDPDVGVGRARLLIRILVTIFDAALVAATEDDRHTLSQIFDEQLRDARALLA